MRSLLIVTILALAPGLLAAEPARFTLLGTDHSVPGSSVTLERDSDAVFFDGRARGLEPGFAYTIWAVVFNDPAACSAGCEGGDLGEPSASILWSGFGGVANPAGKLDFAIVLVEGSPPGQVLFGPGLTDADQAEIHLIVRSHGPASDDPAVLEAQLSSVGGGCDIFACEDVQFAVTGRPETVVEGAHFESISSPAVIGNSEVTLERFDDAILLDGRTRSLTPGHAYTVWAVIFNAPADCQGGCGADDLGLASASILWSGVGMVANAAGKIAIEALIVEGEAPGQVLFGPMLTDSENAEVHLIVRDHGPASGDPEVLEAQLSTVGGGCGEYPCEDVQVAVLGA
jgi:hypothetical protein